MYVSASVAMTAGTMVRNCSTMTLMMWILSFRDVALIKALARNGIAIVNMGRSVLEPANGDRGR